MEPGLALRTHGVTRMGEDPEDSDVDLNSKVHGFEDLYVAGLSNIPENLACNPALTAAAIAVRCCETRLSLFSKQNKFVKAVDGSKASIANPKRLIH